MMKSTCSALAVAALLSACASSMQRDTSAQARITDALKPAAAKAGASGVAVPEAVSQSLLPPLRATMPRNAAPAEPRFDLMVTDAPFAQLMHAIVADTRYSILLSPKVATPSAGAAPGLPDPGAARKDLLTVHLKNVTVLEALEAIRETYGYEFTVQGTRIFVEPPELQTRLYQVNYTLGQRRGVSDMQVVSGASNAGGGSGSGSGNTNSSTSASTTGNSSGGGGAYASSQASALSTLAKSDLWGEIEESLRTVLGCQIARFQAPRSGGGGTGNAGGAGSGGQGQNGGTSNRADVSYVGEAQSGERVRGVDGCAEGRAVSVNQMTGTVLVRGMPKELRMAERLLRTMQMNVERQVIIEAKIIDVQLNKESQQGINWSSFKDNLQRFSVGADPGLIRSNGTATAGQVVANATMADLLGGQLTGTTTPSAFSSGLGIALRSSQFSALLSFLQTQGDVQVLSSPRIATMNNQKAVIKVGTEEPFVTNIAPGSTNVSNTASVIVPPTVTYQPFFSGISLDVTPQIDDRDRVTLHVHALVNSITEKQKIASTQAGATAVPLAVSSVNQTDSIVKTGDGMMVVIGGLMTESSGNNRAGIPGLGDVPVAGALFSKTEQRSSKRELVILIKPTVVKMDSDWNDDIAASSRRVQDINEAMQRR